MPRKTIVCRCEDVTADEIRASIAHGLRDIESLKRFHALGTGPCQGKMCLVNLARLLLEAGIPAAEIKPIVSRPPGAWTPLAAFAGRKAGERS
jgi:sarcosine oxidase subunit beta